MGKFSITTSFAVFKARGKSFKSFLKPKYGLHRIKIRSFVEVVSPSDINPNTKTRLLLNNFYTHLQSRLGGNITRKILTSCIKQ